MNSLKGSLTIVSIIVLVFFQSCTDHGKRVDNIDSQVGKLLSQMTLEEKLGQMSQLSPGSNGNEEVILQAIRDGRCGSLLNVLGAEQVNAMQKVAVEESRLGIPLIIGRDVIHGFRTVFPIPLGMAATWNPEVVEQAYRISAAEASTEGVRWTFAPMIDITWDPRWGRIAEGCGEDPFLASTMASAMVRGIQGDSLSDPKALAACPKHYVGYGFSEGGRDYNTTYISEPMLRNVVLKPFKAAKDAGAQTFMSAFNDLNGIPASGNEFTLRTVLRDEWHFDGFVVSDWESVTEMIPHGYAENARDAAEKAINAGVDMEMVSTSFYDNAAELLKENKITMKEIDDAVRNILRVKYRLGLFSNPYTDPEAAKMQLSPSSLEHARTVARESIVLLKNDNGALPLTTGTGSVAVIGPLADSPRDQLGTWCFDGRPENSVTPLKAVREFLGESKVYYAEGLTYSRDKSRKGFNEALRAAKKADAVLFFAGEEWILSGEGQCRGEINLPGAQSELIKALSETGKPLVVIVMAGRPLAIGDEMKDADAMLYAWHGGTMAGPALSDIIFGKESPSGKLPVTFVKGSGQIPFYYYRKNSGRPATPGSWTHIDSIPVENPQSSLGYKSFQLDYGYTPLLPFGYGLSYTTFEYSNLSLSAPVLTASGTLTVKATVANTGKMDADEVVQLYVRDRVGSITRPVKELKGYARVHIKAGEKVEVEFIISPENLAFFNGWQTVTEPGMFDVWVGPDSDSGLHGEFSYE